MNKIIEDISGQKHILLNEIDRGGQGAVYRTQTPNIAVKLVFDDKGLYKCVDSAGTSLQSLMTLPIPRNINITLPYSMLKQYEGYVMPLMDDMESFGVFDIALEKLQTSCSNKWLKRYEEDNPEWVSVMRQYIDSGGRRRRLDAYFKVACILSSLHANGLIYCDFSANNAFISNKGNGIVWLIDVDNINFRSRANIVFTPSFAAPEVINGGRCSFYSDSYSFAVSLFWHLTGTHPFKGGLLDNVSEDDFVDQHEEKAYSGKWPWIFDKEDDSNSIETLIHKDNVLSKELERFFDMTFSETGKNNKHCRPSMFLWSYILAKELDCSVKCSFCGMDYNKSFSICPWCNFINSKISLKSKTQNGILWEVCHELTEEEFKIPYRIIHGFRTKEYDKYAFSISLNNEILSIGNFDDKYKWNILLDGKPVFYDCSASSKIPLEQVKNSKCTIICNDKTNQHEITLEIN